MISRFRLRLAIGVVALAVMAGAFAQLPKTPRPDFHTRLLLLDAVSAGQRMVTVGERGFILLSDDGQQWRAAPITGTATLTALTRRGPHLWAVGHDTSILKSTDFGTNWRRVFHTPEAQRPLLDVLFIDDMRGFAVGAYGLFLETHDAGEHWRARNIVALDLHFNAIAALGNTLLIAGEAGTLLRSLDAGQTWQTLPSPYAGSWFGIVALDEKTALLLGLRGKLYRTDDAGASWTALPQYTSSALMSGRMLADGTVVVVGNDGIILTSSDGARSFKVFRQPGSPALAALLASQRHWWLFGERGVMRVSAPQ